MPLNRIIEFWDIHQYLGHYKCSCIPDDPHQERKCSSLTPAQHIKFSYSSFSPFCYLAHKVKKSRPLAEIMCVRKMIAQHFDSLQSLGICFQKHRRREGKSNQKPNNQRARNAETKTVKGVATTVHKAKWSQVSLTQNHGGATSQLAASPQANITKKNR